ncbi:IPT/TIG domain-containing protein [Arcicella sp. LKC2W]|uniref:IPT/TIG domain-containing protein n=1 Tax=Arcicella sp. LKC2W TaxID=2984198 RepID=UPI002B21B013|nr:IPT/TIG domain-containing protein [Arcicella sp. LKC2W]MEA5461086.1 IPT/TIG domain-containing protein [Arcicella sp. LKC2W]
MKRNIKLVLSISLSLLTGAAFLTACEKEKMFGEGFDIPYPLPVIVGFTPNNALVGSEITISGENLDKTNSVTIGAEKVSAEIIAKSASSVKIKLPRRFSAGVINLSTAFEKSTSSGQVYTPKYPATSVTKWPTEITQTQDIILRGDNMDLIKEIEVGAFKIVANASSLSTTQAVFPTTNLALKVGTKLTIKVSKAFGDLTNNVSPALDVKEFDPANTAFIPEAPVILADYENGLNNYVGGTKIAQSGINLSKITKGRGEKYLTVKTNDADGWTSDLGSMSFKDINISDFHDPHLTFMVNTNGQRGYFQLEIQQNGVKGGGHFTGASSSSPEDDYTFPVTKGWEWRSISLKNFPWENWWGSSNGKLVFNPKGKIENIAFTFKQGNGGSNGSKVFELNLDQIMVTDGKSLPVANLFDFENGVNPYSGSATSKINTNATISGDKYLTLTKSGVSNWDWTGDISSTGPYSLSAMKNPHINIWVNTGNEKGFFQIETFQKDTKFGASVDIDNYYLETKGQWKRYSLPLATLGWGVWGGTGKFDVKGTFDYFKFGFSTGNISGKYEINIDEVTLSDGPVF